MPSSAAVLRRLVRSGDREQIHTYISSGQADSALCRRILEAEQPTDLAIRLLLIRGASGQPQEMMSFGESTSPGADSAQILRSLSLRNSFLRIPLSRMKIIETDQVNGFGTDGDNFFIDPNASVPTQVDYQHMIVHCLFGHMRIPPQADPLIWHAACDFSAEYLRIRIFPEKNAGGSSTYELLAPTLSRFPRSLYPGSVTRVYSWFSEQLAQDQIQDLILSFHRDDFDLWLTSHQDLYPDGGDEGSEGTGKSEQIWKNAREAIPSRSHASRRGFAPGSRREKILLREESRHDFRGYLRRFAVIREEVQLDTESFDYIPYYYGIQTYGNMPLLEPLEYTEAFKVEQLAIAIDTSGSCDTAVVQRFLTEVHAILTAHDNFFKRMEVHILQCDSAIHEHRVIHSTEEWMEYIENISIQGRGGTDFTPVFHFLEKLRNEKQLLRLKGLLYFTDGDGIYPRVQPSYETAFIFSRKDFMQFKPPSWCVKLCMDDSCEERI